MIFKEGLAFKTRNGLKAVITRICDGFLWADVHTTTSGIRRVHYFSSGRYHSSILTALDLVEPWIQELYVGKCHLVIQAEVLNGTLFFRGEAIGGTLSDLEGKKVTVRIEEQ